MRVIFILIGAALLSLFSFVFLLFGLRLIYTAVQLFRHRDEDPDVEDNAMVKGARRILPISEDYIGGRLFAQVQGCRVATPLFVVLVAIGGIDLLFALESIPAVFGVISEPFIVFAANAFALLDLRALFFLVKGLLDRLVYLLVRAGADPGVHRGEAGAALAARRHRLAGAGDPDDVEPVGDRRRAGDRDRGRPDQDPRAPGDQDPFLPKVPPAAK
ncbi:hypothetical protein JOF55_004767 [Haloactinomyces albus]|uniref:Uncharacterized protein n=1 Tax=Haloactinomyces albus TaxID=1352928 RepID=A0AAE3ZJ17_9ACTN|nr:hypothetical protein [Haloactinomyces albus]